MSASAISGSSSVAAEPNRTSIMSPHLATFVDARTEGVFDKRLPSTIHGGNWLDASPSVLAGVGPVAARKLARRGLKTVRDVAASTVEFATQDVTATAAKALDRARKVIRAAAARNGISIGEGPGIGVDSPKARPANVGDNGVKLVRGFGVAPTQLQITYGSSSSNDTLIHEIDRNPSKITVRIAQYVRPGPGKPAAVPQTATIDLGVITTGATVVVVNKDGKTLFTGATPATSFGRF